MALSGKDELTPREREVLELVLLRRTNEKIAEELVVSLRTVETHVTNVLHKRATRTAGNCGGACRR
jgi:DNA-binding NarL/FixJ family response regulator